MINSRYLLNIFYLSNLWHTFEELALTLNGKKRKIKKADFVASMQASGLEEKVITNIFAKFAKAKDKWFEFIDQSFLPDEMKEAFKVIIAEKLNLLA